MPEGQPLNMTTGRMPKQVTTVKQMHDRLIERLDVAYVEMKAMHTGALSRKWTQDRQYRERLNMLVQKFNEANKALAAFHSARFMAMDGLLTE